jgi:very-short-patch-repair endonuclease
VRVLDPHEPAKVGEPPPDAAIAAIAARQHGVISRRQLLALGLGSAAIHYRVQLGRLHRVHRGVYAVGHRLLSTRGAWMAAVLAAGDGAVLSHRSAAALHQIRATSRSAVDVTRPTSGGRRRGIDIHRARLTRAEKMEIDGIPVTTVARTLLDLCDVLPQAAVHRAFNEAEYLGLLDVTALSAVLTNHNGRTGTGALRQLVTDPSPPKGRARSNLERTMLTLCKRARIPAPEVNRHVHAGDRLEEVDFLWRDNRLIVEVDGWAGHRTRKAFERDRRKDAALTVAGYRVVRFTWRQLTETPDLVVHTLRALLALPPTTDTH